MNREEYIKAINQVGWKVQPSWNGLNDKLISPTGKETDIRVMTDSLEPYSNNLFGGESWQMSVKWFLKTQNTTSKKTMYLLIIFCL